MVEKRQTLGENVVPLDYTLRFEPNLKTFKYKCSETISIKINKRTSVIAVNAVGLEIKSVMLVKGKEAQNAKVRLDKKLERAIFTFKNAVSGLANLKIEFEGVNGDKLAGFYRTRYKVGKKDHFGLTTQFEAPDARKAFPCFDEPNFKATFDLSFLVDKKLTVLSNMPEKSSKVMGGKKLVSFQKTPKMSSYLLYFGIGEFDKLEGKYRNIALNVITTPGKIKLGEIALDYGKKFMKYYEDYFGLRYPLPKMDFIAVPDFAIGGMENWGAITYAEFGLLADKKTASVVGKQRIAELTAHELAHQWFGDLVTMKWWDDLWLNESFATFMSYKAMDDVFPEWQMGIQAVLGRTASALGADQLRASRPIGVEVNSPGDTAEAFDPDITYNKGSSVLTMLEDYAGADVFRKALHSYMKEFSYSNATRHDLWNAISKVAKSSKNQQKFDKIASYWINNPGYPAIEVKYADGKLGLEQKRFVLLNKDYPSVWPVPIHYVKKSERGKQEGLMLFDKKKMVMKEEGLEYIKLNYLQKGFYRVKYPDAILQKLGMLIREGKLSPLDGWGIENDLYSLARGCKIKVGKYLDFVERYCMDCKFPLDLSVSGHLNALSMLLLENKLILKRVNKVNSKYHNRALARLGWERDEKETNAATLLRAAALSSLGFMEDKVVVNKAKELFEQYLKNGRAIDSNIRNAIYSTNAWVGNMATYEKFVSLYKKEENPEEKIRFLRAIASFKNPVIVDKALKYTFSKDIRLQYVYAIPYIISTHENGKKIIWPWVSKNWKKLMGMYDRGMGGLDNFLDALTIVDDQRTRDEIERFFKKKSNFRDDIRRTTKKTLEFIDINIRFREFNDN